MGRDTYRSCFRLMIAAALIFIAFQSHADAQTKFCPLTDAQSRKAAEAWALRWDLWRTAN